MRHLNIPHKNIAYKECERLMASPRWLLLFHISPCYLKNERNMLRLMTYCNEVLVSYLHACAVLVAETCFSALFCPFQWTVCALLFVYNSTKLPSFSFPCDSLKYLSYIPIITSYMLCDDLC